MELRPLRINQQHRSQESLNTQRNPMGKLCPSPQQLAQLLQCPMVTLCHWLQAKGLLHSHSGPMRLVRLVQAMQCKAQAQLQLQLVLLRTVLLLPDQTRRPWFLHLSCTQVRDPTPRHQLVMILRPPWAPLPPAFYTDHPRRRLRLKAVLLDLLVFPPMYLKYFIRMVAQARNLPTQR